MKKYQIVTQTFVKTCLLVCVLFLSAAFSSCGGDDEPDKPKGTELNQVQKELFSKLSNTSWKLISSKEYNSDGSLYHDYLKVDPKYDGQIFTLSDEIISSDENASRYGDITRKFYTPLFGGYGGWVIMDDGTIDLTPTFGKNELSASDRGGFSAVIGFGQEVEMTSTTLKLIKNDRYDDGRSISHVVIFQKIAYQGPGGGSGSGSGSGGSQGYEKPEIGFYDFTATKSSVTVYYQIYNSQECGVVTSATISYGTSTPSKSVTASVSGTQIRATISGLKAGTTYKVKCTAKGPGGSTTSSVSSVITNF